MASGSICLTFERFRERGESRDWGLCGDWCFLFFMEDEITIFFYMFLYGLLCLEIWGADVLFIWTYWCSMWSDFFASIVASIELSIVLMKGCCISFSEKDIIYFDLSDSIDDTDKTAASFSFSFILPVGSCLGISVTWMSGSVLSYCQEVLLFSFTLGLFAEISFFSNIYKTSTLDDDKLFIYHTSYGRDYYSVTSLFFLKK